MTRLRLGDPPDGREAEEQRQETIRPWLWGFWAVVALAAVVIVLVAVRPRWTPGPSPDPGAAPAGANPPPANRRP